MNPSTASASHSAVPVVPTAEHAVTGVDGRALRLRVWLAGSGQHGGAPAARTTPSDSPASPPAGLSTARPDTPATGCTGLPALLLLDGQYLLQTIPDALPALRAGAPMLVASLGFASSERAVIAPWRARDYTPAAPGPQQCDPRNAAWPCGGADTLLALLKAQVLPLLQARHGADPARIALFGHSYAGLFALHTWLTAPSPFCHIYAASPSLWWYWPHLRERVARAGGQNPIPPSCTSSPATTSPRADGTQPGAPLHRPPLTMLVGSAEQWRPLPAQPGQPRPDGIPTAPLAEEIVDHLHQHHPHAHVSLQILPELAHGPMLHAGATLCLADFQGRITTNQERS
ncbi:MAG: alpha/beta hydrolase-fold protein [Lautropia sp.]|nr:alpha/beta hydrolase-fold protein [Lautropia sp.]